MFLLMMRVFKFKSDQNYQYNFVAGNSENCFPKSRILSLGISASVLSKLGWLVELTLFVQ
jgi:hypothetical protein